MATAATAATTLVFSDHERGDALAAVATTSNDHAFPLKPPRKERHRSNICSGSLDDLTTGNKSI
jgi:hypothetical protein